jgi:hypothetical protein
MNKSECLVLLCALKMVITTMWETGYMGQRDIETVRQDCQSRTALRSTVGIYADHTYVVTAPRCGQYLHLEAASTACDL